MSDAETFPVYDPSTGKAIDEVTDGTVAEAARAVGAADAAAEPWRATSPRLRGEILRRAYDLMIADSARLATIVTRENGKPLQDAKGEIAYAADFLRWYGEEAVRHEGSYGENPDGGQRAIVTHRPVGISALVTPWNFPAAMVTRKIAPALAAGCTVLLKPASETPRTALEIADLLTAAGVPKGVVNVVPTTDAAAVVSSWLADSRVRKLSFTGSTEVGRSLLAQAARRVLNTSMELGGNAPFIVADDADIDLAVEGALVAKFRNGGQACTAANRFLVHASVASTFVERFCARVAALTVGPGDSGADIGPMISERAVARITSLVDGAVQDGASLAFRGDVPGNAGYFVAPTVLSDVPPEAQILTQEIFGPIAPVSTWNDIDELASLSVTEEMGLAGYVFSQSLQRSISIAEMLEVGMVGINRGSVSDPSAPFGGMRQSGLGREGGRAGIREFQEPQAMSIAWPALTAAHR